MGKNGEIIPIVRDPEHCVVDKNAPQGVNPKFFTIMIKMSVNEMCEKWPDKKEDIYKECSIIRGTYKQLETIVTIRKVYLTYYDKNFNVSRETIFKTQNTFEHSGVQFKKFNSYIGLVCHMIVKKKKIILLY